MFLRLFLHKKKTEDKKGGTIKKGNCTLKEAIANVHTASIMFGLQKMINKQKKCVCPQVNRATNSKVLA